MTSWLHWPIAPLLVSLLAGAVLLLVPTASMRRTVSIVATLAFALLGVALLGVVLEGGPLVYALGGWARPFGIVLVADRLSAMLVALSGVLGLGALTYAIANDEDRLGSNFHVFFQFQLLGIAGAFLTGDLFNLFVFFEILLISSYCLLLHGQGRRRIRAALHVVVLNLIGSALFLIAIGLIYGTVGTLNMADLALEVAEVPATSAPLLRSGALLLLVVFSLKAALFPLYFWLPEAYASACASVACLFAIMTKVGIYAVLRVFTLVFGSHAGPLADVAMPWLLPAALVTVVLGAIGALASADLRRQIGYLVIVSVGTTLASVGLGSQAGTAAALYYLVQSTLVTAGFYLLADLVRRQRGADEDDFAGTTPVAQPALLGSLFFVAAVVLIGLPPASGFVGKLAILQAAADSPAVVWLWTLVLGASLASVVAVARAGSDLFWRAAPVAGDPGVATERPAAGLGAAVAATFILSGVGLAVFARPVLERVEGTARELHDPKRYIGAVLAPIEDATPGDGTTAGEAP